MIMLVQNRKFQDNIFTGFESSIDKCDSGDAKKPLKAKEVKKCTALEKKLVNCGFDCTEKAPMTPEEVLATCGHEDKNFPGAEMFSKIYVLKEDCVRDCQLSESCKAISYRISDKRCYFKSSEGGSVGPTVDPAWISSNMECDRSQVDQRCQRSGFYYYGADIRNLKSESLSHCALLCRDTETCKAISYRETDGNCYLKNRRGGSHGPVASAQNIAMNLECDKSRITNFDCMREGISFSGTDLRSVVVAGAEECIQHCKDTEACKSVTFRDSDHQCYLKSKYGGNYPTVSPGHRSMNLDCDNNEVKNLGCLRKGFDFPGAHMGNLVVADEKECVKRCKDTEGCKAITFRTSDNRCYLRNKAGGDTGPNAAAGHNSMNLQCDNSPVKNLDCIRDDTNFPGADLRNFIVEDKEECVRHCRDTERCKAVVFTVSSDQLRCYLKDRRGGANVPVVGAGVQSMNMECDNSKIENLNCIRDGINFSGGDIGNTIVTSVSECVKLCRDTEGCQGFSFRVSDKRCYTKNRRGGASGPTVDITYNSLNMECDNTPVTENMKCLRKGINFPGSDLRNLIVANVEECVKHCRDTENCHALTFIEATHRCYLKNKRGGVSGPTVSPGHHSLNMECDNSKPSQLQCGLMAEKFPGYTLRGLTVAHFEECLRRCKDTEGCQAVSFSETDNVCELKSRTFEWWTIKSHHKSVNMDC